jgi:DNA-binding transcriptional MerR regulator
MHRSDIGMTSRQAESWRRSGLLVPAAGEIAQLRVIAALRRAGVSPRRIRVLLRWLRATSREAPRSVRFAVHGREVYVGDADGSWEGDANLGQLLLFVDDDAMRHLDLQPCIDPPGAAAPAPHGIPRARRRVAAAPATSREAIGRYLAAEARDQRRTLDDPGRP